jgi:heparin/heparan-sulfate lyase
LPILLTLVTVLACVFGITAAAETMPEEETRSCQITHASLVLDNNVDLLFYVDISEATADNKETFMTFNEGTPVFYSEMVTIGEATYAVYRYENIMPKDLAKVVTAKFYVNSSLTSMLDYSVKNYAQLLLTKSNSAELKTLLSDLLVYGAEAQALAGDAKEEYVTNGVVGLTASQAPSDMVVLFGAETEDNLAKGETVKITSSKLLVSNGMQLSFDLDILDKTADSANYTVSMAINGREQEVDVTSAGYFHRALFNSIYSYELFDVIKVNVYNGNVRASKTFSFSLASYIDALNGNAEYTAITNAYYNYCYSSHIYAGTHTAAVPGTLVTTGTGSSKYDDNGTITYTCSLCGEKIDDIKATHIRTFDAPNSNGNPANKGSNNSGTLFTIQTLSEALADGTSNSYLSITRDLEKNTGKGSGFGYYFSFEDARLSAIGDFVDNKAQYTGNDFSFSFDVKAPEAGLASHTVYLQNTNTSSTGRYYAFLTVKSDGSLVMGSNKIAPAGTVNSSEWTNISVNISRFESKGVPYLYFEYYVNGVLYSSVSATNNLLNKTFTKIYVAATVDGLEDGEGMHFDNFVFAQGCVRSFNGSVEDYVGSVDSGNLRKVIEKVHNEFDTEDFYYVVRWDKATNTTYKERQGLVANPTDIYAAPEVSPKNYDHPRLLFNTSDIPAIVENMERPENAAAYSKFMDYVTTNTDGKLTPTSELTPKSFEHTNYDTGVLRAIEAKAMYYALFKNDSSGAHKDAELRGYEAIYAMKNYMLTFDVQWDMSDQCRMYGEGMYYAALVYDWCYDLLTEEDMLQFRLGVQNLFCDGTSNDPGSGTTHEGRKLEGGFPALLIEQQSALTGHGAEAQVLRDYFSFAIAIYDEDPTWYSYVGGMIYTNYIDARDYFYSSGYYPDGSAGYNVYRYVCDLYNAWLFKGMGVEIPYNDEDMATVIHGLMAMEINDNFMFATADGSGTSSQGQYRLNTTMGDAALISSYLFNDNVALTIAERLCAYEYNRNGFSHQLGISCAYYLILTANDLVPAEDYREKIANVEYHGGFQQQIISRNDKSHDSVVVLSQGAQHYPGGHTHQNAGSFQIWYKGMLTRDDGLYDAYGSQHHFYYHMSATAHNTLLIYNENLASSPVGPSNNTQYYNGGQKYELNIPVNYPTWIANEKFSYGNLIGMQTDDEMNPSYVYFANDITAAYDVETVDYVERSTMTLYTGDAETPMVMFIFDNITSDSPDYQKTFLLQCVEEPVVNGNTVTVDNGEGKLVLTSLLGADNIYAYGRTSKNGVVGGGNGEERFYLSGPGVNLLPGGADSIGDSNSDLSVVWGHVEIQPNVGQETNHLMNVLYVSDSGNTVTATPTLIEGNYLTGATFKNNTTVFVNDITHSSDSLSFETTGEGTMTYYVGGLTEGEWKVMINGEHVGNYEATSDGKMLTFTGDVGTVQLEPGDSMRPAGTQLLFYNLNGGKLPEGALNYYFVGETTILPTPTKTDATFEGWYTDKELTQKITQITPDMSGRIILYAKWIAPILSVNYTTGGTLGEHGAVSYNLENSQGQFKIMRDENGVGYLYWTAKQAGGIIGRDGKLANYSEQSLQVSYMLTLGRDGDNQPLPVQIYLRDSKTNTGSNRYLNIFKTDGSGNAYLGTNIKFAQIPASGMITLRFVLDFETGKIYAYDEDANLLISTSMSNAGIKLPAEYDSYADWFINLNGGGNSIMTLKGNGAGSLRIQAISVWSGNVSEACRNFGPNSSTHTWSDPVVIKEASTTDCTPGEIQYTCSVCNLTKVVAVVSSLPHSNVVQTYENEKISYSCQKCGCAFNPSTNYYLDGSSLNNIVGIGNNSNFITVNGTNQPVLSQGAYELINDTGERGKLELWIPTLYSSAAGFSATSNARGFISLKVNAFTDESYSFYLVDTSSNATRWSSEWCITDAFLTVSAPKNVNGKTTVDIIGWDGVVIASVEVSGDNFTGWVDVKACVEFNSEDDTITLHYYGNGEYLASCTKALTTKSNGINSICITGYTSTIGSGLMIDDIAFGYSPEGVWIVPQE